MMQRTEIVQRTLDDTTGEIVVVNQYRLLAEAGRGQFSRVRWVEDSAGKPFAAKVFHKGQLAREHVAHFDKDGASSVPMQERVDEELRLLAKLDHVHVMKLVEVLDDPNQEWLYCVLEGLVGGPLMNWEDDLDTYELSSAPAAVRQHWGETVSAGVPASRPRGAIMVFQEDLAKIMMNQLLAGVAYLHSRRVVHKDLKPDNLLLTLPLPSDDARFARALLLEKWPTVEVANGGTAASVACAPEAAAVTTSSSSLAGLLQKFQLTAKIGDFNSAVECDSAECLIYDAQGTNHFTPPECFMGASDGVDGKLRDAWSMGCVLFCMLFGKCPYWAQDPLSLQFQIIGEDYTIPDGVISDNAKELISRLMCREVENRLCVDAALKQPWLSM